MEKMVTDHMANDVIGTPQNIAWELLFGNHEQIGLNIFTDNQTLTYTFEILITIFMELVFNLLKLNHYSSSQRPFIPDYSKFNLDTLIDIISEKISKIGYIVAITPYTVEEFEDDEDSYKDIMNDRYCRVILKYYDNDEIFDTIDKNLFYHMKLNGYKHNFRYSRLQDIYAIVMINGYIHKITFAKNII